MRSNPNIVLNDIRSGYIDTTCDSDIAANYIVMSDMTEVVNLSIVTDDSVRQSATIDACISAYLNIVSYNNATDLGKPEFISFLISFKTKAFSTNHGTWFDIA